MSDSRVIKIQSNPYRKEIRFLLYDQGGWHPINESTSPLSKLIGTEIANGFLPFKAKEIVDTILQDYGGRTTSIELIFEGTSDEYAELEALMRNEYRPEEVSVRRGAISLNNARTVLPLVKERFESVRDLLTAYRIKELGSNLSSDYEKFIDATRDEIPLCVIGSYSAGKSTFINALLGHELLPNGDEPVTSRIFRIRLGFEGESGLIALSVNGQLLRFRFDSHGLVVDSHEEPVDRCAPFLARLTETLDTQPDHSLVSDMRCVLQVVNELQSSSTATESTTVSDIIDITIPCSGSDPWCEDLKFTIFDTPGSNAASNRNHTEVLKSALRQLSGGLAIFVCEKSTLDSNDNLSLYHELSRNPSIDERFAMVVVNKADMADLANADLDSPAFPRFEAQILRNNIPRTLNGQGVFFVSSILGLGAKTQGQFSNKFYEEKFESTRRIYEDPGFPYYKQLYRFNIQPDEIKREASRAAEACSNLLLANSGLFSIEREILLFAKRYSIYNKCVQAKDYLEHVLSETERQISIKREQSDIQRRVRDRAMERSRQELVAKIEEECDSQVRASDADFKKNLELTLREDDWRNHVHDLEIQEDLLYAQQRKEEHLDDRVRDVRDAAGAIPVHLGETLRRALDERRLESVVEIGQHAVMDFMDLFAHVRTLRNVSDSIDENVSKQLHEATVESYQSKVDEICELINRMAWKFWESAVAYTAEALRRIVKSSQWLSEDQRIEIFAAIHRAEVDVSNSPQDLVNRDDFLQSIDIFSFTFRIHHKLDLNKLDRVFDEQIVRVIHKGIRNAHESYSEAFASWVDKLKTTIVANIVNINPDLREQQQAIERLDRDIARADEDMRRLKIVAEDVDDLIDWHQTAEE